MIAFSLFKIQSKCCKLCFNGLFKINFFGKEQIKSTGVCMSLEFKGTGIIESVQCSESLILEIKA